MVLTNFIPSQYGNEIQFYENVQCKIFLYNSLQNPEVYVNGLVLILKKFFSADFLLHLEYIKIESVVFIV